MDEYDQSTMVHALPRARHVERLDELVALARGRDVIHVGFADRGCRDMQTRAGTWLHRSLDGVAKTLVGLDLDDNGVAEAVACGYAAHAVDCTDRAALRALHLGATDMVIAGEVVEHVEAPGAFFAAMRELVIPGGRLVVTTPNAYGWINVFASLAGREVNHPDHIVMFTWRTITNLAARHGWAVVDTCVYVPAVKETAGCHDHAEGAGPMMRAGARAVVGLERAAVRLGRSYAADGLLVVFRRE